jgi:predicted dehydrogenase
VGALGIGIIGVGKHGLRYVRHLTDDVPDARLVALCRRDRREGEPVARAHGCAFYDDWRALVEDPRVDAVVTAVPPVLNAAIAEAACAAGKHLLLEKPLAPTLEAGRRIAAAVRASFVRAMVAQTLRFDATVAAVRAHLPSIAPVHAVSLSQRFEPSPLAWLDRVAESGGGVLLHTGIHSIDLLRLLSAREVTEVSCLTARVLTRETEDNFAMLARLGGDGLLGQVSGSRAARGRSGRIEVAGADGEIVADHVHQVAWLIRGATRTPIPVPPPVPTVREALRAFVAGIRTGAPMPVTVDDGLRAVAIVEASYRSAAHGGAPVAVEA